MDIFDQAMGLEKIGEDLYTRLALEAPSEELRNIFSWLADREEEHYQIFKKMKEDRLVAVPQITVLTGAMEIFEAWRGEGVEVNASEVDLYRKALEAEKKSVEVYEKHAASANGLKREIFLAVAEEEKRHQRIMENIIKRIAGSQTTKLPL
jgi:rubrerythrin